MYRTLRFATGAIFAALVVAGIGVGAANAQAQTPAQLLQQNPNGGQLLINALQQLVLTEPRTFDTILGAVGGMNDQQKTATATALTQAAKVMVLTNEALATEWQQKILAITDPTFKTAAVNAFGDVKLGAIGGGPLGGPAGGPGGGGGGALEAIVSGPTATHPFTWEAGVAPGSATITGGSLTINTPVSDSTSSGTTGGNLQ